MKNETFTDLPMWEEFKREARKRRKNPLRLVTEYMQERLEIWEDEALDKEISRSAQRSGYKEKDAVEIVRQYRLEKKGQRAASFCCENLFLAQRRKDAKLTQSQK